MSCICTKTPAESRGSISRYSYWTSLPSFSTWLLSMKRMSFSPNSENSESGTFCTGQERTVTNSGRPRRITGGYGSIAKMLPLWFLAMARAATTVEYPEPISIILFGLNSRTMQYKISESILPNVLLALVNISGAIASYSALYLRKRLSNWTWCSVLRFTPTISDGFHEFSGIVLVSGTGS